MGRTKKTNNVPPNCWNGNQETLYETTVFLPKDSFTGRMKVAIERDRNDKYRPYCARLNGGGHYFASLQECFDFVRNVYGEKAAAKVLNHECKKTTTNES